MGRYKSSRFVPGERLAFRVFGEVRRRHTMYGLPFWDRENAPPEEILFETPETALAHKARLIARRGQGRLAGAAGDRRPCCAKHR
jgi:hypothetical protein